MILRQMAPTYIPMYVIAQWKSGYGGTSSYGGYQQQQYQQPAEAPASAGYGQYGSYAAPVSSSATTAGYTPEQQAAYAQYYGYQYGAGMFHTPFILCHSAKLVCMV